MKRTHWTLCTGAAAGALGLILAGCSSSQNSGEAPAPAKTTSGGGAQKRVAVISPAKTSQFHVSLADGAREEARRLGWPEIIDKAPGSENNYSEQVSITQDVLQQRPDAISVCGINPQTLGSIVRKANEAKIPIFVHNQIAPVPGDVVARIGYDEQEAGKLCGETVAAMLKAKNGDFKGTVGVLDGDPGTHTDDRAGSFKKALAAYPNIKVVAEQNGHWVRTDSKNATQDWLQKYPTLDAVFGCSDQMAQGASQAAQAGAHPLITVGIDGTPDALQDVKAGKLSATLATQPAQIGAAVIDTMRDYLAGKKVGPVVKTAIVIVTKENVSKFVK